MKIFKRSQIAIIAVSLMLVCAGYLEYKYGPNEDTLGANIYISGKDAYLYQGETQKANAVSNNEVNNTNKAKEENIQTNNESYLLDKYRLEREKVDSQLIDNYKQLINGNTSQEQKKDAQEKLDKLLNDKKVITVVEALLRSDVIQDIVIMPTNNNINIVVSSKEELEKDQVKQIQTVVQKEMSVKVSQISITRK